MQTDPNWSNFFYDSSQGVIHLLDFGACREFSSAFTGPYLRVVYAAAKKDEESILQLSKALGFLTGEESSLMIKAHIDAVKILGEPFATPGVYDFEKQNITGRIQALIPVMLRHRLTPPPEESYSLHRKLAGAFLLCSKLKARISCSAMLDDVWERFLEQKARTT